MIGLREHLERLGPFFGDHEVGWSLVGGLAVSVHAEPRFTRDLDLALAVGSDDEAERLVRDLGALDYTPATSLEHLGRLAAVRLVVRDDPSPVVDLLFASSGIEAEIVEAARGIEAFEGLSIPVAGRPHLVAMKLLAESDEQPQHLVDLRHLVEGASEEELEEARNAVRLIRERGYHRGRNLLARLDALGRIG